MPDDASVSVERPFTVVLLYPDYATNDFGGDVYVESARAASPEAAVSEVQAKAYRANDGVIAQATDLRAIVVFAGDAVIERGPLDS